MAEDGSSASLKPTAIPVIPFFVRVTPGLSVTLGGVGVGVTVSITAPVTPLRLAVIEEVLVPTALARPVAEMLATEGVSDAQNTWLVRFWVKLSEKVPVAANCWMAPRAMFGLAGVTAIDSRVGVGVGD